MASLSCTFLFRMAYAPSASNATKTATWNFDLNWKDFIMGMGINTQLTYWLPVKSFKERALNRNGRTTQL